MTRRGGSCTIYVNQKDDEAVDLTFRDKTQPPVNDVYPTLDITGYSVELTVKSITEDDEVLFQITQTPNQLTDPTNGFTTIDLTSDNTDLPLGSYPTRIVLISPGDKRNTIIKDVMVVA